MDHFYNYYKKLPRDEIVGGFIEFAGADDADFDVEIADEDHLRAEIYGGAEAQSASTIDEGILKLFADSHTPVNPKRSRARSEDAKTAEFGAKTPKEPKKRRKKGGDEPLTAETFTL